MLTADDIMLVRASFARVVPVKDAAADLFYARLFERAPQLRKLFPADLRQQKQKLMATLTMAVGALNDLDVLVPKVKALGMRHAGYGATAAHYDVVGDVLLFDAGARARRRLHAGSPRRLDQSLCRAGRHHAGGCGGIGRDAGGGVSE